MQNPFDVGYYGSDELRGFGFASIGRNVKIARNCNIVRLDNITIGDNVQIDSYCQIIATGPVRLGSFIHIGAYCMIGARGGFEMDDFSGLSQGVRIYTASDDYSGRTMTNPTVPAEFTGVKVKPIHLGRHAIIGSGAVLLPGASMGEGSAVGALSLVTKPVPPWTIVAGNPAKAIMPRRKDLLAMEARLMGHKDAA